MITLYPGAPPLKHLSLGTSTFGREIDEPTAFSLMDYARDRGITLFDTAATYSQGASEEIVGQWLEQRRPHRETLTIATKIYPPYTPEAIDANVAACSARLRMETLDVLYLHKWDPAVVNPATLVALDSLLKSGRVRSLGVSNFNAGQFAAVLARQKQLGLAHFSILQNNNNLAVRDVDDDLRKLCTENNASIITYSPLGAGFLTGKHQGGVQAGSRFAIVPAHQKIYFTDTAQQRLLRLAELAQRYGHPMPRLALAWAINCPQVSSVLIGGRTTAHLDQAFDALTLNAPPVLGELNAI